MRYYHAPLLYVYKEVELRDYSPTRPHPIYHLFGGHVASLVLVEERTVGYCAPGRPACSNTPLHIPLVRYTSAQCADVRAAKPSAHGHVLGYIRARILVIVPLCVRSGRQQTRSFSPELAT